MQMLPGGYKHMDDIQFFCSTLENKIVATRYRHKAINRNVFLLVTPRMCIINLYTRPCFKGRSGYDNRNAYKQRLPFQISHLFEHN